MFLKPLRAYMCVCWCSCGKARTAEGADENGVWGILPLSAATPNTGHALLTATKCLSVDAGPTIVTSTSPPPSMKTSRFPFKSLYKLVFFFLTVTFALTDTSTVSSAATRAAAGVSSTGGLHIPNTEARGVAATITPTTSLEGKKGFLFIYI